MHTGGGRSRIASSPGGSWTGSSRGAAERLHVKSEADRLPQAALLLATVDRLALLDAVGCGTAANSAVSLHALS